MEYYKSPEDMFVSEAGRFKRDENVTGQRPNAEAATTITGKPDSAMSNRP